MIDLVPLYQSRLNLYSFEYVLPAGVVEVEAWNIREALRLSQAVLVERWGKSVAGWSRLVKVRRFDWFVHGWRLR